LDFLRHRPITDFLPVHQYLPGRQTGPAIFSRLTIHRLSLSALFSTILFHGTQTAKKKEKWASNSEHHYPEGLSRGQKLSLNDWAAVFLPVRPQCHGRYPDPG
jgi:hypothetical protein